MKNKWDWLKRNLEDSGISQADFARSIKWQQTRMSELLCGKRDFPSSKLYDVAHVLGIDLGELAAYNSGKLEKQPKTNNTNKSSDTISIEMLDVTACCGTGEEIYQENIIGSWNMPALDYRNISTTAPDNVKMLKVKGDSMEPTLKDGDWVLVDIARNFPDSDGMFLINLSTGLAVKRLQGISSDEVSIISDNVRYNALNKKLADVYILGKVIYTLTAEKVG